MFVFALLSTFASLAAQGARGAQEVPDVYVFGPDVPYVPKYKHDPAKPKLITNPDFYCSQCSKEGRIAAKTRNDMRSVLESKKVFPMTFNGKTGYDGGRDRLLEHDGATVVDFVFRKMRTKNPVFIEDGYFRSIVDFDGFSTKADVYPRRERELEELSDIFPDVSKKTVELNFHHRAHLYLIRAHRVMKDFNDLIEYNPKASFLAYLGNYHGLKDKFEYFIFDKQPNLGIFIKTFLGHPATLEGECWHTLQDDNMAALSHCDGLDDFQLNNAFTHRMAFNFLQGYRGYQYNNPAWFQLGFGHLMERRERTDYNTFIFGEGRKPDIIIGSKWKPAIRKMVEMKKMRPFAELANFEDVGEIKPDEHQIAWSLVSYLMQLDQKKFLKFYNVIKDKKQGESVFNLQIRAFQTAYGLTMTRFFDDWQAWVLKTYPTQ